MPLPRSFYRRPAYELAPALLGCKLVRTVDGQRLAGLIIETEAYQGQEDQACHARSGRTARCEVMWGEEGYAYIYFTYGMHWMLNLVAEQDGFPAAVLIRAIFPTEGLELMQSFRPRFARTHAWLNGPAKLTQAMGLDGSMNGADLCSPASPLFLEEGLQISDELIHSSPRVGIGYAPEPWLSMPWRWQITCDEAETLIRKANL